jgi:hypothetical protein
MAFNLTAQVRSIAQVARALERGDPSQQITVKANGTAKRQHTVAEITEAVNGTPSGLFHQYREVPERTGQIAPKVPRHLTMKVTLQLQSMLRRSSQLLVHARGSVNETHRQPAVPPPGPKCGSAH